MAEAVAKNISADSAETAKETSTLPKNTETKPSTPVEETQEETAEQKEKRVTGLIDQINTGEWRSAQESERLERRYGEGLIGKFRQWLGGEFDFSYDQERGELVHNQNLEIGRRATHVAWKAAKTAAIIAGISLLTGGAGAVPAGAILGSSLARGFCEAWKGFSGTEGKLRQEMIIARQEYYKDAEKLASEIAEKSPEGLSGPELEQYQAWRGEKTDQLVNLVKLSERKVVQKKQAELDKYLSKWRTTEELLAFAGGMTGGLYSLMHAKSHIASGLHHQLDSGHSIRMNIDQDKVFHSVSRIDEGIKTAHHLSDNYVFHYNSVAEATAARGAEATVLNQGEFGSHIVGGNVYGAISRMAEHQAGALHLATMLGLAADVNSNLWFGQQNLDRVSKAEVGEVPKEKKAAESQKPKAGENWIYKSKKGEDIAVKIVSVDETGKNAPIITYEIEGKGGKKTEKLALAEFIARGAKLASEKDSQKTMIGIKDRVREASGYTLENIDSYSKLNAESKAEGEKKFKEITREIWNKFAVHGILEHDKKGDTYILENSTDLDGRTAIGLFKRAGFNTEDLKFVNQSAFEYGRVNLDTGDMDGVVLDRDHKSLFFDHHAEKSALDYSAASLVYETLVGMDLLDKDPVIEKAIAFIIDVDNCRFAISPETYRETTHNLYGLWREMEFETLYQFFKDGKDPKARLSEEDIKKYGLEGAVGKAESSVRTSEKFIKLAENEGFTFESDRYGRVFVDIEKKIQGSYDAVRAFGYDTYVIWSPSSQSFFISSNRGIQDKFAGGKIIRTNMSIKPRNDKTPLKITLGEIVEIMSDRDPELEDGLEKYLETEKLSKVA